MGKSRRRRGKKGAVGVREIKPVSDHAKSKGDPDPVCPK